MDTVCVLCGKYATGLATINDDRYCHGDDDLEPTCYMRATWARGGDTTGLLRDAAWNEISGDSQNPMEKL